MRRALALLALCPLPAWATLRTVEADGSGQYATIQAAIDASTDGDEIQVGPGTWAEAIDLGSRSVTLIGTDGADVTTLAPEGEETAIVIWGGAPVIEGFTVTNPAGRALVALDGTPTLRAVTVRDSGVSGTAGGGLYVAGGTVTIEGSTFSGNQGSTGGAIYAAGALEVTDSVFSGNVAEYGGGAVELSPKVAAHFADSVFSDNVQATLGNYYGYGGAIDAGIDVTLDLERVEFTGNGNTDYATIYTYGGAVFLGQGVVATVTGCTFSANVAYYGGGIFQNTEGDLSVDASSFSDDYAYYAASIYAQYVTRLALSDTDIATETTYYYGAGLYVYTADTLTLDGVEFSENLATYGYGGALMAYYVTTMRLAASTFTENVAYYDGGALYLYSVAALAASDVTLTDNVATYGNGGAAMAQYITDATLTDVTITGNAAYYAGGGLYWSGALSVAGGTVTANAAELRSGGGMYLDGYDAAFVLDSIDISDNACGGDGGGVAVVAASSLSLTDARLVGNEAGSMGGALYVDDVPARGVADVVIEAGTATYGGGVYVSGEARPDSWKHVILAENEANVGGGGVFLETTRTDFTNSVILGNAASEQGAALYSYIAPLTLVNTAVAWNAGAPAIYFWSEDSDTRLQYDAWWENGAGDLDGAMTAALDSTNVQADPMFHDWSDDGDDTNDSFVLDQASALIDAGDPALLDPDGSQSDIGLLGGELTVVDNDGDGAADWQDCDDADASVHPGATDTPYDGLDADCGGDSDWDQDGDGVDAGDDCDDTDPTVVVCDSAPPGDTAVDDDDTGVPDLWRAPEAETEASCGCRAGAPAASGIWMIAAACALARRRSRMG